MHWQTISYVYDPLGTNIFTHIIPSYHDKGNLSIIVIIRPLKPSSKRLGMVDN